MYHTAKKKIKKIKNRVQWAVVVSDSDQCLDSLQTYIFTIQMGGKRKEWHSPKIATISHLLIVSFNTFYILNTNRGELLNHKDKWTKQIVHYNTEAIHINYLLEDWVYFIYFYQNHCRYLYWYALAKCQKIRLLNLSVIWAWTHFPCSGMMRVRRMSGVLKI